MSSIVLIFIVLLRVFLVIASCERRNGDANDAPESDDLPNGPTFIDQMRIEYLQLEHDMWNDIKFHISENTTKSDDFSMLDQIRNHHLRFLSRNFHEFGCELNLFEREDEIIFDAINKINYSVVHARLKYLKDFANLQDKLKMILIAQDHLDLTPQMNYLFEFIASYGEYFQYVSVCVELVHGRRRFFIFCFFISQY